MNKMDVINIMNEVLSYLDKKPSELAKDIGLSRAQALYDILNPNIKVGISKNMADLITTKFPQINKSYLLTGEGEMLNSDKDTISKTNETNSLINTTRQPILDIRVSAGIGIGLEGDENKVVEWVSIPSFEGCKGITVYGDSMYDKFKSGDIIFVRPITSRDDIDFGQCYVIITREDRYIKNLYESAKGDDFVTMVSFNTELNPDGRRKFPDRDIIKSDILFLYKVAGKLRRSQL